MLHRQPPIHEIDERHRRVFKFKLPINLRNKNYLKKYIDNYKDKMF